MMYFDPTGHWEVGDEKFDNFVQLALLVQTDKWDKAEEAYNNAKTQKERNTAKRDMDKAAADAKEIRSMQTAHIYVRALRGEILDEYGLEGIEIVKNLEIIDKEKMAKAMKDNSISKDEWKDVRNVVITSQRTLFMKGKSRPKEIYLGERKRDLPVDDSEYNSLSFIEKLGMDSILATANNLARTFMISGYTAGFNDAADMMAYWLSGEGGTYYVDFIRMNREDSNAKRNKERAISDIKEAGELLTPTGKLISIVSVFEKKDLSADSGDGVVGTNWFNAIGNYRTWTEAAISATANSNGSITYKMAMGYYLADNYRWYMIDENGDVIPESSFHLLHLAGLAREYRVEGLESIFISWTK